LTKVLTITLPEVPQNDRLLLGGQPVCSILAADGGPAGKRVDERLIERQPVVCPEYIVAWQPFRGWQVRHPSRTCLPNRGATR
jgi:hypothetical protein